MIKPKRRTKPFYLITGTTAQGVAEEITSFTNKAQILKGLRQQGLNFDKYQSITIHCQPVIVYEIPVNKSEEI